MFQNTIHENKYTYLGMPNYIVKINRLVILKDLIDDLLNN